MPTWWKSSTPDSSLSCWSHLSSADHVCFTGVNILHPSIPPPLAVWAFVVIRFRNFALYVSGVFILNSVLILSFWTLIFLCILKSFFKGIAVFKKTYFSCFVEGKGSRSFWKVGSWILDPESWILNIRIHNRGMFSASQALSWVLGKSLGSTRQVHSFIIFVKLLYFSKRKIKNLPFSDDIF